MNRNSEYRFDLAPHETMHRSKFDMSNSLITTLNCGDIVPLYVDADILPGDTFSVKTSSVVRLQTLLDPIFSDLNFETFWFFIPHRLVWEHWKEFMGENNTTPWTQQTVYTIPQLQAPSGGWAKGTIADYMGIPIGVDGFTVNALPFRAYALTMSQFFRRQAVTYPVDYTRDETTVVGTNGTDQVYDIVKGGYPFKSAKRMDLFTACLPSPQQGNDVMLPLGDFAPVVTRGVNSDLSLWPRDSSSQLYNTRVMNAAGNPISDGELGVHNGNITRQGTSTTDYEGAFYNNLWTNMSQVTGTSVNQLRMAFQLQKYAERTARSGNRYIELIRSAFGTISPDARQQRAEYLGGDSTRLNIHTVTQSSATGTNGTPQGHQAAYSVTGNIHGDFSKSFTEHGTLLCVGRLIYKNSYSQGLERQWTRKTRMEFYDPLMANIGEQKIRNDQIYLQGTSADSQVFGYNEAWAEYRYKPDRVTSEMRPNASGTLASWHLGDNYASLPSLSDAWMRVDKANLDRCLAVQSSTAMQCFGQFYFDITATRVMPTYSIPGLIDHH